MSVIDMWLGLYLMLLETMEYLEKLLEPGVLANLIVAVVAIWYTIETQRLRLAALNQVKLMRQSMFAELLPFVLPGLRDPDTLSEEKKKAFSEQTDNWRVRRIELPGVTRPVDTNKVRKEVFEVTSTTDQVASHVLCLMFETSSKRFAVSQYHIEVIAPREIGYFNILEDTLSPDEACELIEKTYEDRGEYLKSAIKGISTKHENVLFPIFFDLGGRLYATPRPVFRSTAGAVTYGKSDLLQQEGYPEVFAPPFSSTEKRIETA